ncbi:MAG TPA: hypothetical protein VFW19_08315 [Allosphingosinicella sp.]|nr:hypothetical protein [Allosphingosinicella sp.]
MTARVLPGLGPVRRFAARLRRDTSGLALIEFAFAAPIMLTLGLYGLEAANLAIVNMRISQITSNLADTASRIGLESSLALKQIRESDIDDAFQAVRLQGGGYNVTTSGRFILSSLEQNSSGGQWIHWQRCVGQGVFSSTYGGQGTGSTGTSFAGMGATGSEIKAPAGQAVMFVETYYVYQPLVSARLFGTPTIHTTASFIVRDVRNLTDPDDPVSDGGTSMTCDKHTT